MNNPNVKSLHLITFLIIVLSSLTSATGLLYTTGGQAFNFINQYGNTVRIYGDGLYAHDSYFMAAIFRGTDFAVIFFAIPILIIALVLDIKRKNIKSRLFLTSVISFFTYYSTSIAFGAIYNILHLVYIVLFAASFFGLILAISSIDKKQLVESMGNKLPLKRIYMFLGLTGTSLIVAWLPDIITSLASGRSLELIEVYTTQITYVVDMGILAPIAFIALFKLRKGSGIAYILLTLLFTLCAIIGVTLPIQTAFQLIAGISLPLGVIITKVGTFVALAFFAVYFNIKIFKNIK